MDAYYLSPGKTDSILVLNGKRCFISELAKMCRDAGISAVEYKDSIKVQIGSWLEWQRLEDKYPKTLPE